MWRDLLFISLWGGIVALDTTAAFQILISHPLVSGSVVGLMLGNFPLGFSIGIILELVWLNELPIGGAPFAEGNIGGTAAAATAIITFEQTSRYSPSIAFALLLAVFISWAGGQLVVLMRSVNGNIYQSLLDRKHIRIKDISRSHLFATSLSFVLGLALTAISVSVFAYWLFPEIIKSIPASTDKIFAPLGPAFLGAGCGVLLYMFYQRKHWWLFLATLLGGTMLFLS